MCVLWRVSIARQRVGKHIPATHAYLTMGRLGSALRLYNEDLTQLELELGRVLEKAVEDD
jgi:hypothetical protein